LIEINKLAGPSVTEFSLREAFDTSTETDDWLHLISFIIRCWHWASSLDWWERGVVGALVGGLLFIVVPTAIFYAVSTSLVAYLCTLFSSLDLWQRAALGALVGAVLLILVPAKASTRKV
jgi:hypothetical protein